MWYNIKALAIGCSAVELILRELLPTKPPIRRKSSFLSTLFLYNCSTCKGHIDPIVSSYCRELPSHSGQRFISALLLAQGFCGCVESSETKGKVRIQSPLLDRFGIRRKFARWCPDCRKWRPPFKHRRFQCPHNAVLNPPPRPPLHPGPGHSQCLL